MRAHIRAGLVLLLGTLVLGSIGYPLAVLTVAQTLFPANAAGSLVDGPAGRPVGSRLIAQDFPGDVWFHPRPSAVQYDASAAGGSNWAASNPELRQRVVTQLRHLPTARGPIPADAVTASGSGLDPHITLAYARLQLDRMAAAWARTTHLDTADVRRTLAALLDEAAFRPLHGLVDGEPLVNVLELNLEVARRFARGSPPLTAGISGSGGESSHAMHCACR